MKNDSDNVSWPLPSQTVLIRPGISQSRTSAPAVRHQAKDTLRKPCDKKNEYARQKRKYAGQKKEFHEPSHKKEKQVCGAPAFLSISYLADVYVI